jgi:hypothetical protein
MVEDPSRWEGVYQNKQDVETRWFEGRPQTSHELIAVSGATGDAAIIEVGPGFLSSWIACSSRGFDGSLCLTLSVPTTAKAYTRLPDDVPVE